MTDKFVWELPPLDESEEPTALIPVSADGSMDVTHKMDIQELVGHQLALNPILVRTQRLVLARYSNSARASESYPNLLDFVDNPVRDAFDNYDYLVAGVVVNSSEDVKPEIIEIEAFNESDENQKIALYIDDISIWRISDNSFGVSDQTSTLYLKYLYGYRILPYIATLDTTGLRFVSEAMYIFKENETFTITLPAATGGTPPYTYAASGLGNYTLNLNTRQLTIPADSTTLLTTYTVTDDDGQTVSIPLTVTRYTPLSLGRYTGTVTSLPTTITFPEASGGVPPYSHYISGTIETGSSTVLRRPTANSQTITLPNPRPGFVHNVRLTHRVTDSIGQQSSRSYYWRPTS